MLYSIKKDGQTDRDRQTETDREKETETQRERITQDSASKYSIVIMMISRYNGR